MENGRLVAVFFLPNANRGLQTFCRHFVVEAVKHTARGSESGDGVVIQRRDVGGEGPAVVRRAGISAIIFQRAHAIGINTPIGFGSGIAEMRVLLQRRFDYAWYCVAKS